MANTGSKLLAIDRCTHLFGIPLATKQNKAFNPIHINTLSTYVCYEAHARAPTFDRVNELAG